MSNWKDYVSLEVVGPNGGEKFFFRDRSGALSEDYGPIQAAIVCRDSGCLIRNCEQIFGDTGYCDKHWGVGEWVAAVAATGAALAGGAWLWRRYR